MNTEENLAHHQANNLVALIGEESRLTPSPIAGQMDVNADGTSIVFRFVDGRGPALVTAFEVHIDFGSSMPVPLIFHGERQIAGGSDARQIAIDILEVALGWWTSSREG